MKSLARVSEVKPGRYGLLVDIDDEKLRKKLEGIPGLVINESESRAEGRIDAVAAACFRLGIDAPPRHGKIEVKLPKNIPLKKYQEAGIAMAKAIMAKHGGCLLADDMGLGKTRQAIVNATTYGGRILVVGPAFAREVWRDELTKLGEKDHVILEPAGTKKQKEAWLVSPEKRWVVTSFALAGRAFATAFADDAPRVLILDEFHNLRGRDAERSKEIRGIAAQVDYKIGLTGTPQWSRLRDWWMLLSILYGNTFGNQYDFDKAYCGGRKNEHGGWDNYGATNQDELKKRLTYYMIRRTKGEVADELPKCQRQVLWVDPTKEAQIAFHHAIAKRSAKNAISALQSTLQGKIDAALEIASQAKQFLLFTYLKSHAHQMAKVLAEDFDTPCVCLTGDLNPAQRQAVIRDAVARKIGVVATIDSAGTGINGLQQTISVGIMHCLDYVPIKMAQAEGRLDRIGQTSPVMWYYLAMKDSMDSLAVKTIVHKMDQVRAIMGQNENKELRDALSDSADPSNVEALEALYEAL